MPYSFGRADAIPARSTPGKVRNFRVAAATAPPVFPAETKASARPSFTMSIAMLMDESFFRRTVFAPGSAMPMTSGAWTMLTRGSFKSRPCRRHSSSRTLWIPTK